MDQLRVNSVIDRSRVNGPGSRAVVWTAGCTIQCPGCHNPQTHARQAGDLVAVDALASRLVAIAGIEGVTLSGGEPLQQAAATLALLRQIRSRSRLSVVLFSGFTWAEIQRMPVAPAIPHLVDVLIAGRYDAGQRVAAGLVGSMNKELVYFTDRYTSDDFRTVPPAEIRIGRDGTMTLTGIDPVQLGGRV